MSIRNPHEIDLPKKVVVGTGILDKTPKYLNELGFKKNTTIAVITGPKIFSLLGKKLINILEEHKYNVLYWIAEKASKDIAENIASEASRENIELFIGFGGGKAIDVAKYTATQNNKPFISIPTAASHDGIASPFASLKGFNQPMSIKASTPLAIIADIEIIAKAPPRLLRAGVGDLVGKLTAVKDWQLAHRLKGEYYGEYAAQLALLSAKHVLRYHELIASGSTEGVRILVEALISSSVAMCIAGSSRPASGSEHLFSHALDLIAPKPALHGEQVGVGTIMMLYLYGDPRWRKVKKVLEKVGAPTTAKELGIPDEIIIKALTIAHRIRKRYTILGDNGLTWEAAERLARATGVID
ncbi:NAD(P)-dependent glycerol-1-phosphate dehydrogenase [Desulfurococcaceae archaeon MEX13E-LK6-19]|nr:NAD(P)-dependent glycerol-1-phosphate dehydrogenase [Desulfurococcaceae archaeon MEX13E-LK6-19]